MMVAGGAECRVNPLTWVRYTLLERLAPGSDGGVASRPFDRRRTGQVGAEAAAVLMLEGHDAAEARGARIYGEILGNGSGTTTAAVNACDPDGRAVAAAVRGALADAGVEPREIGAIVAHGTALPVQDKSEAAGLARALGEAAGTVPVTATKGVTGNPGAASGPADLAAALVYLRDGKVPPIVNCGEPDTEAGLNLVVREPQELRTDKILVTSNAIGGQAAAIVVRLNT
jgi:3-oxoacyl-[acyl-carrier-protein] synthase II